jgi:hypothetical protein
MIGKVKNGVSGGLALPHILAGVNPARVTASHGPGIRDLVTRSGDTILNISGLECLFRSQNGCSKVLATNIRLAIKCTGSPMLAQDIDVRLLRLFLSFYSR